MNAFKRKITLDNFDKVIKERELEVDEVEQAKLEKEEELEEWANSEYESYLNSAADEI